MIVTGDTPENQALAHAVVSLAGRVAAWTDADLERPWEWKAYDEGVRYALFRTMEELRELAATTSATRAGSGPPLTTAQRVLGQYHVAYRDLQAVLIGVDDALGDQ